MNPTSASAHDTPLVSVVICFFNPPPAYFREAIESVLRQTYLRWELFLVDNGSTNGSEAVAMEYVGESDRIRYLHHPHRQNKGPAASRNLGIRHAAGRWIAFLDADDLWLPDKLAQQVEAMLARPDAVLSFGGILRWYNGAEGMANEVEEHTDTLQVLPPGQLIRNLLHNKTIPGMSALMVRTDAAVAVGGFEESLLWAEDQTISYRLGLQNECLILPCWKVKYRQHPQSTTSALETKAGIFSSHLGFLKWVQNHFDSVHLADPALRSELRRLLRQYRWLSLQQRLLPPSLRTKLCGAIALARSYASAGQIPERKNFTKSTAR